MVVQWNEQLAMTEDDALVLVTSVKRLEPDDHLSILVELNGMITISRRAFVRLASTLNASAVAFLGTSPVEQVLVAHFRAVHIPPYPVQYFQDRDDALTWAITRVQ